MYRKDCSANGNIFVGKPYWTAPGGQNLCVTGDSLLEHTPVDSEKEPRILTKTSMKSTCTMAAPEMAIRAENSPRFVPAFAPLPGIHAKRYF